jgi:uncharacterized protein (TIGR02246 family)
LPKSFRENGPTSALPLLCAAVAACSSGGSAKDRADLDSVRAAEQAQLAAYRARDADAVVAGYAADAAVIAAGQAPATGRAAIRAGVARMIADPAFSIALDNRRTEASGDIAFTSGTYRVTYSQPGSGQTAREEGQYLTVFRRQADGSWKAVQDIAARAAPPPG